MLLTDAHSPMPLLHAGNFTGKYKQVLQHNGRIRSSRIGSFSGHSINGNFESVQSVLESLISTLTEATGARRGQYRSDDCTASFASRVTQPRYDLHNLGAAGLPHVSSAGSIPVPAAISTALSVTDRINEVRKRRRERIAAAGGQPPMASVVDIGPPPAQKAAAHISAANAAAVEVPSCISNLAVHTAVPLSAPLAMPLAGEPAAVPAMELEPEMSVAAIAARAEMTSLPRVKWAGGYRLHLSSYNQTGYTGVCPIGDRYHARYKSRTGSAGSGKLINIGCFTTPVDAAVAYAKHVAEIKAALRAKQAEEAAQAQDWLQAEDVVGNEEAANEMESDMGWVSEAETEAEEGANREKLVRELELVGIPTKRRRTDQQRKRLALVAQKRRSRMGEMMGTARALLSGVTPTAVFQSAAPRQRRPIIAPSAAALAPLPDAELQMVLARDAARSKAARTDARVEGQSSELAQPVQMQPVQTQPVQAQPVQTQLIRQSQRDPSNDRNCKLGGKEFDRDKTTWAVRTDFDLVCSTAQRYAQRAASRTVLNATGEDPDFDSASVAAQQRNMLAAKWAASVRGTCFGNREYVALDIPPMVPPSTPMVPPSLAVPIPPGFSARMPVGTAICSDTGMSQPPVQALPLVVTQPTAVVVSPPMNNHPQVPSPPSS